MTTERIFAAIDISDEARKRVTSHIELLRSEFKALRVGWEKPEKLHITLKFFGDADIGQIVGVQKGLAEIASGHSPFTAELAGPGVFPNARRPRVLWLGIQNDAGAMTKLGTEIERLGQTLGFPAEKREFSPHLTIGRLREPERSGELAVRHLESGFDAVRFSVNDLVLYQSKLQPSGSVYSVVSRHAF